MGQGAAVGSVSGGALKQHLYRSWEEQGSVSVGKWWQWGLVALGNGSSRGTGRLSSTVGGLVTTTLDQPVGPRVHHVMVHSRSR